MKKLLSIVLLLFCAYLSYGQTPFFALPPRSSPAITVQDSRWRAMLDAYMPHTHGLTLNGGLDTVGAMIYEDSSRHMWYRDTVVSGGHKWTMFLTQADVVITGLIQQGANVTITGAGTFASPYIINASGGGGGGITTMGFTSQNGFTGNWASPTGPTATLSIGTSITGLLVGNGTGLGAAIIGTGLSFIGSTLTNTINNTNQLTNGAGFISNITGLVSQGSNVTITGSGTLGSPYVINATSGGTVTGAGNLPPLFTTGLSGGTITFTASNAAQYTLYGNFTGSSAVPTFGQPSLTSPMFANQGTVTTVLIGNAAGNLSFGSVNLSTMVTNILAAINGGTGQSSYTTGDILYASSSSALSKLSDAAVNNVLLAGGIGVAPLYGKVALAAMANFAASSLMGNPTGSPAAPSAITLGYGLKFVGTTIAFDSANVKDSLFAVEGLTIYGQSMDSIGIGGAFFQNASVSLRNLYAFQIDSAQAGSGKGWRVNFGSDAGYDMFYRDSATGYWKNFGKGTINQVVGMLPTGGIGWVNQSGGGSSFTRQNITSGSSGTVGGANYLVKFNPASPLASYALTFATGVADLSIVKIEFGGTITSGTVVTSLSILPGAGWTIQDNTPPTSATADNFLEYQADATLHIWYRRKP